MASSYLDFELDIGIGQGQDYLVAALRPAGEARVKLRISSAELAALS